MNLCFLMGKIISEIQFEFVLNSKNISIVKFKIELENKSIVTIKGYNEIADFCYSKLKTNYNIFIYGKIDTNMEIEIDRIKLT